MNLRRVRAIFVKEVVDMLRDRRTLMAMIGLPVVMYPLVFIFGSQAAMVEHDRLEHTPSDVAVDPRVDPALKEWIQEIPMVRVTEPLHAAQQLYEGKVDAVVRTEGDTAATLAQGGTAAVRIDYDAAESDSRQALKRVVEGLSKESDRLLAQRLNARGLDKAYIRPLDVRGANVASTSKTTGAILGMILPMVMVIMLGVGAFYPAIDLTAGEKERGTFETLLSTPTSTTEIVFGKFLTVFCLSLFAGLMNLGSLLLTLAFQISQLAGAASQLEIHLPAQTVLLIALVIVPLAFFISALMMTVAMFARTFKEAQNFVTPFFLLIMLPAVFAAVPGTELTAGFYFVPIANVALLFKALMTQAAGVVAVFAVFLSTAVYAILALYGAVWVFKHEDMILSDERGIPLTLRRSRFHPREAPTPGMALFLYAVCLVLFFYVGTYFARAGLVGLLITEWGLILPPTVLILWYTRVDLARALSLRAGTPSGWLGTLLLAAGWVVLVIQLQYWQNLVLPMPKELAAQMSKLVEGQGDTASGLAYLLFALAVSPAVCEETLFRGAILSGLRTKLPFWATLLAVGLLFGVLHVNVYRLLVTTASGIVLTYIVIRTGSIFAGMATHFLINGSAVVAGTRLAPFLDRYQVDAHGMPVWVLAAAAVLFAAGIAVLERTARSPRTVAANQAEQPG